MSVGLLVPGNLKCLNLECYCKGLQTGVSNSASSTLHALKFASVPSKMGRSSYSCSAALLAGGCSSSLERGILSRFLFKPIHRSQFKWRILANYGPENFKLVPAGLKVTYGIDLVGYCPPPSMGFSAFSRHPCCFLQAYLCFAVSDLHYQSVALHFAQSTAPWVLTKVLAPVLALFPPDIRYGLPGQSPAKGSSPLSANVQQTVQTLNCFSWIFNLWKSSLETPHYLEYLWLTLDIALIFLPRNKLLSLCSHVPSVCACIRVLGLMIASLWQCHMLSPDHWD